ncbi:glycosyltransferase family 2 protein [Marinivivus vitaminiproducens]|uniref:glycosyltransferase family 2 protein n=1 Tax=Marinivivus vitaminiproducens TaxID=3035935 RepID=UPI0027989B69|nr:glycosyltransferase [Geminicoccaceae bacterium SCSIO 64248]
MSERVDASVVIPAYNAEAFIVDALAAAQKQTVQAVEILVVDDGSTDGTRALVEAVAQRDPRVRLFRQPTNRGPSAARNRAFDEARGDWLVLLDADDTMDPERIARLIALGNRHKADLVADNIVRQTLADRVALGLVFPRAMFERDRPMPLPEYAWHERISDEVPPIGFIHPIIRRSFVERHGVRYPEAIWCGEDSYFTTLCLAHGAVLWTTAEAYYRYTMRSDSLSYRDDPEILAELERQSRRLVDEIRPMVDGVTLGHLSKRADDLGRMYHYRRFTQALKDRQIGEAWNLVWGPLPVPYILHRLLTAMTRRLNNRGHQLDPQRAGEMP